MEKRITADGSVTFYSEAAQETYHTQSGAVEESFEKHVSPSHIVERAKEKKHVKILDFCFGLGYNTAAAIDAIRAKVPECIIEVVALENDSAILNEALNLENMFECFDMIKEVCKNHTASYDNVKITLLLGDAKETLLQVTDFDFDVVFFDPFSPKKQPDLWTQDIFIECYLRMCDGARLTTYSCARAVREAMKEAGFTVIDGPIIGRRSPSTIAIK